MEVVIVENGWELSQVAHGQLFEFCDDPGPKYIRVRCELNKFSTGYDGKPSEHGSNDKPQAFGKSRIGLANNGRHDGCWCYLVRVSDGELGSAGPGARVIPYEGELQITRIFGTPSEYMARKQVEP